MEQKEILNLWNEKIYINNIFIRYIRYHLEMMIIFIIIHLYYLIIKINKFSTRYKILLLLIKA